MIKTVKKIGKVTEGYLIPLSIFEFSDEYKSDDNRKTKYLTGAFFNGRPLDTVALYKSDENGNILDEDPFILEEGIPNFELLFKNLGWVLI